ncbi:MAG TPA: hypothetical protein VHQ65_13305 [Thermoanaerobaculia bacterium]|nr:hypothetical protein [Thermoanaerobaculia bacterium]
MSSLRGRSSWQWIVVVALVAGLAVPRPVRAAVETGADSPQALVARLQKAAEAEDFSEIAACMAPEDRAMMSMMLMMASGMMVAFAGMGGEMAGGMAEAFADEASAEDKAALEAQKAAAAAEVAALQAKYEAILTRYGVDELMEEDSEPPAEPGPAAAAKLLAGVDQVGLIAELMKFMREAFPEEAGEEEPMDVPMGELADLRIDGDHASATIGGEPAHFVRIDGRWYAAIEPPGGGADPDEEAPAP